MPKTKSAKKRLRQSSARKERGQAVRSRVKTAIRTARTAVQQGAPEAQASVRAAGRELDKAASKGVLHKHAAARRKSRLARRAQSAAA